MIKCPKCNGEGKVKTVGEELLHGLELAVKHGSRAVLVLAAPFVSVLLLTGLARMAHWAVGAPTMTMGWAQQGPLEPTMGMGMASLGGLVAGLFCSAFLVYRFWISKP